MMNDGVHAIDTIRWMCGGEVADIQACTKSVRVPDVNFILAILHFDNGTQGIMINSWSSGKRLADRQSHGPFAGTGRG